MPSRAALLALLHPDLGEEVLGRAGGMLDAVTDYLDSVPAEDLGARFPVVSFDPAAASAYLPDPAPVPAGPAPASAPVAAAELGWLPAPELAGLVRAGLVDPGTVRDWHAERVRAWEPTLNAFIRRQPDPALASTGSLAGVSVGLTDLIDVAGQPTTCGSALLTDNIAETDADCWRRLSAQGAMLGGKLNVHEFAAGTTGYSDRYGWVRNPYDPTRMAGGACGGAGAAVAAGLVSVALGPDPGGSIRVPAAHCGVVALKPTYGAIDRTGMRALTWTLDTLGIIAQRVAGVAAVADLLLAPHTPRGPRGGCLSAVYGGAGRPELPLRVGVPTSWLDMGLEPAVAKAFDAALDHLRELGVQVREVDVPSAADILRMHRAIAFSEASAGHEQFLAAEAPGLGAAIRDREYAGRAMLAGDYLKALRIRAALCATFSQVWREVDVVATPSVPVTAAPIGTGEVSTGSIGAQPTHTVYTRYAAPISSLGLPALSVPCGFSPEGLPIGLQLVGPPHAEPLLFHLAGAYESSTGWHREHPGLA